MPASRTLLLSVLKGESGDKQRLDVSRRRPAKGQPTVTTTILAAIGGITLILTAATRLPAALAEFLRACILVAAAARDLRNAFAKHTPRDATARAERLSAKDSGH
jgi:hypothetical protein